MKRFLLFVILFVFISNEGFSVNRTWNGGSSGNWGQAANWMPNGVPTINDDLTINTNTTITIDVSPLLSSLLITGNVSVVFAITNTTTSSMTRIFTPTSTSSLLKGFQLDNGSSLTLETNILSTGSGNMSLRFNAGVYGQIDGTLIFNGTLTGTGNPITSIILNTGAIVQVTGKLQFYEASDNISGSTPDVLSFASGSSMEIIKNGGSFPDADWALNSQVKANNATGINPPSFNGTIYGNLEWNCPNQQNYSLAHDLTFNNVNLINTKNGASSLRITNAASATRTLTINGNLTIGNNAKLELTGIGVTTGGGRLSLKGNLNNQGLITTSGVAGTVSDIEFNGTTKQYISNTGILTGARILFITNNTAGIELNSSLTLPGNLSLANGNIITTSANLLTMIDDATVIGGSSSSFIEGPMKKIGDEDFTFPLGKGTMYAPLSISGSGGSASDAFTAEYIRANPQSTTPYGPEVGAGLDHVSYVEYWTLTAGEVSPKNISLQIHSLSFCKMLLNTFMAKWNSSIIKWEKINTSPSDGPYSIGNGYITGKIITTTPFVFGINPETYAFTLATDQSFDNNPLPVDLISFQAKRISSTRAILNWELAACCLPGEKFEIEKAGNDRRFKTSETISGNETDRFYSTIDQDLKAGNNYYRLKMIDANHTIRYSHIIAVLNGKKEMLITMSPTIVNDNVSITITSATVQQLNLFIADVNGRIVKSLTHTALQGNSNITLSLGDLSSGVYHITGVAASGQKDVIRFIKQ